MISGSCCGSVRKSLHLPERQRPSDKLRQGSRACETAALAAFSLLAGFLELVVAVEVHAALTSKDFQRVDDAAAYIMNATGNPFRLGEIVACCGVSAIAALVVFVLGFALALFSKGARQGCLNTAFLVAVVVLTVLQLGLAMLLLGHLWQYVPVLEEAIEPMCLELKKHACSDTQLPDFVEKICSVMADVVRLCATRCGFVTGMCGDGFGKGLRLMDHVFGATLFAGIGCNFACCCLVCIVSELTTGKSAVDTFDCCGCMDRYDRSSHAYAPLPEMKWPKAGAW